MIPSPNHTPADSITPVDRSRRLLDWLDRAFILGMYGWLVLRIVSGYQQTGNAVNFILLACEGLVVFFLLIRRSTTDISRDPREWFLALSATGVPLLIRPGGGEPWLPASVGAMLMFSGLVFQIYGKICLGRSFGCVPANRGLILHGPYRYVRHPIYAGYLFTHVAFLLMNPSLWNLAVYCVAYGIQVPRLLAEERFLRRDPRYQQYMGMVRYRLLPGVF